MKYKLQTYNRIIGIIKINIGKQMSDETKLRILNTTAKEVLKYESAIWMLNKTGKQRFEAAQMRF
jgi:hypothetical protein